MQIGVSRCDDVSDAILKKGLFAMNQGLSRE